MEDGSKRSTEGRRASLDRLFAEPRASARAVSRKPMKSRAVAAPRKLKLAARECRVGTAHLHGDGHDPTYPAPRNIRGWILAILLRVVNAEKPVARLVRLSPVEKPRAGAWGSDCHFA